MKMKKLIVAALAAAITVGSALPASAAWVQSGSEWRYQNQDGSWQANRWFQEDGKWYHFDANGNAQKGWLKDTNSKWYFFAYNGIMQTGLIKVDDKVYYMNADGSLFSGNMKIGTVEYNFTEYGITNGNPSVGASQTFGGNGNQTNVIVGGGGYSRSGGGNSSGGSKTEDSAEVTEAKKAVKEAFEEAVAVIDKTTIKDVKVVENTINFTYANSTNGPSTLVSDTGFIEDVQNALNKILDDESVSKVKVGNQEFTKGDSEKFEILASAYEAKTVGEVIKALNDKGITVYANNEPITYSVAGK